METLLTGSLYRQYPRCLKPYCYCYEKFHLDHGLGSHTIDGNCRNLLARNVKRREATRVPQATNVCLWRLEKLTFFIH